MTLRCTKLSSTWSPIPAAQHKTESSLEAEQALGQLAALDDKVVERFVEMAVSDDDLTLIRREKGRPPQQLADECYTGPFGPRDETR